MRQTKTVSVVMCTYNGARFLREQMDSVLAQTYPLKEIIVQDDGSTDATMSILNDYAQLDARVKVYRHEGEQHGINANFLSAMRRAEGDYIAICDQDDVWEPYKIALQIEHIGDCLLCGGRSDPFSSDGSYVSADPRRPNVTLLRMLCCAEIAGHTMLLRRDMLNYFPEGCEMLGVRCYDAVFSVTAAALDSVVYIDRVLVHQRRYATSSTFTSTEDSQPTVRNAFHMLLWSLRHYRQVRRLSAPDYAAWERFLCGLHSSASVCAEGIRMMRLMQSASLWSYVRFSAFCLRHRNELFHTRKPFAVSVVRALLFPLTSCWYQRFLILDKK